MDTNCSKTNEVVKTQKTSLPSWELVLAGWLAKFTEHYGKRTSQISVEVFREELSDLSAAELDAACRHAIRRSEFFPVVATIRNALRDLRTEETPSTLIRYPEVSPEDRVMSPETQKIMDELKVKLGIGEYVKKVDAPVKIFTPKSAPMSFEKQKEELRRRGLMK